MAHDYVKYPELTNQQLEEEQFTSPHPQITEDFDAVVVRVRDGDTVILEGAGRDFTFPLRFLNIDAPELSTGAPGQASKEWLKQMVEGKEVQILINPANRVDKYGRLLGTLFYRGMDIGSEMVYLGLAKPFARRYEGQLPSLKKELDVSKWF